ncbi:MAG: GDSL-type esterase/lipase family protein [Polyangiaceae bacterium]|nr:GDSL-type esterase/lipase family protein [Polyangiaceae bacterium]
MKLAKFAALVVLGPFVFACSSSSNNGDDDTIDASDSGGGGTIDSGNGDSAIDASDDGSTIDAGDSGDNGEPAATIHIIGRTDPQDPAASPRFSWSGTQIRTRFSGTGATIKLADMGNNWFDVSIDGVPAPNPTITTSGGSSAQSYVFAPQGSLADAEHDLVITKRNETSQGDVQFLGITTPEGRDLIPTTLPFAHRLEFVGDSISAGYGVFGPGPDCDPSINPQGEVESEPSAYPALTAAALHASHHTIAYSGIGLIRNYNGNTTVPPMSDLYKRTLVNNANLFWDFSYVPDAIIINLGTNDFSNSDPGPQFETAYVTFMEFVRSKYPNAFIVAALSPMVSDFYPIDNARTTLSNYLSGAVAERQNAGDNNVAEFEFEVQLGPDYGCDYHPNVAEQQALSDQLVPFLRAKLGW